MLFRSGERERAREGETGRIVDRDTVRDGREGREQRGEGDMEIGRIVDRGAKEKDRQEEGRGRRLGDSRGPHLAGGLT